MNKDQIQGRLKRGIGEIKKGAGKALGNIKLEAAGRTDEASGKVQSVYGDFKNAIDKKSRHTLSTFARIRT